MRLPMLKPDHETADEAEYLFRRQPEPPPEKTFTDDLVFFGLMGLVLGAGLLLILDLLL